MKEIVMALGEIFDRALKIVVDNRQRRLEGGYNSIPFSSDKLNEVVPGMQRKNMVIVSAGPGVGKSKFTKLFYVIEPFEFVRMHPDTGIKLDLFYFCLEESKENFIHSVMVYKLAKDYNLIIPIKKLKSITSGDIIEEGVLNKIRNMREWFEEFEQHVRIIDNVRNPTGIYKEVENFIKENGHWIMKKKTFTFPDKERGTVTKEIEVHDYFVYDHPQHYVGVIIDHISLLMAEKGLTQHQTMTRMSSDYGIALRDKYLCSVTIVQQQALASENKQYTNKGVLVEAKLEPTLATFGDNKLLSRDADEIIALFTPMRHDLVKHRGYDILKLQNNYRSVQILKSRDGEADVRIGMFFNGAINYFEELPRASMMEQEDYEYFANKAGRTLLSSSQSGQQILNFS